MTAVSPRRCGTASQSRRSHPGAGAVALTLEVGDGGVPEPGRRHGDVDVVVMLNWVSEVVDVVVVLGWVPEVVDVVVVLGWVPEVVDVVVVLGALDGEAGALELGDEGASVGLSFVDVLQAVSAPIPTMAIPPAASASCLVKRADIMDSIPRFLGPFIRADYLNYTSMPGVSACRTGDDCRRTRRKDREEARAAAPQAGQKGMSGTTRSQCTHVVVLGWVPALGLTHVPELGFVLEFVLDGAVAAAAGCLFAESLGLAAA